MRIFETSSRGFVMTIAFLALLCSCVKNDPLPTDDSRKHITFTTPIVSSTTKAVPGEMSTYDKDEKFRVTAIYTPFDFSEWDASDAAIYMNDQEVSYYESYNGWRTAEPYYWPKNGKLTFIAYSPSTAGEDMESLAYGAAGYTFKGFSLKADPTDQYDLMYSERALNKISSNDGSGSGVYDCVDLNFRHALSCIEFRVRNGSNFTSKIVLKGLKINHAYSKGTFEENIDTGNQATYNANPAWKDQAEVNDYTLPVVATGHIVTDDITEVQGCKPLLLIPQSFKHSETEHVKIQVTYSTDGGVDTEAEIDLVTGFDSDRDGHGDTYFNDGTNPIMSWEPGKKYIYTITFGQYKIFFTPSVETWEGGKTPPVYI